LYLAILYNKGYFLTLNATNGNVISGKKWNGGTDAASHHLIMRSILVNSKGNAAYALVYASDGKSVLLRTNPMIYNTTTDWALSCAGKPWGVVFGKTED
jgi:hypothetical protein